MSDQSTTVKTSSADALTDLQQARQRVIQAGMDHANHHTRATKLALRAAQAEEQRLTLNYYNSRLMRLAAITTKQQRGTS